MLNAVVVTRNISGLSLWAQGYNFASPGDQWSFPGPETCLLPVKSCIGLSYFWVQIFPLLTLSWGTSRGRIVQWWKHCVCSCVLQRFLLFIWHPTQKCSGDSSAWSDFPCLCSPQPSWSVSLLVLRGLPSWHHSRKGLLFLRQKWHHSGLPALRFLGQAPRCCPEAEGCCHMVYAEWLLGHGPGFHHVCHSEVSRRLVATMLRVLITAVSVH
jgi:hypothetical protein